MTCQNFLLVLIANGDGRKGLSGRVVDLRRGGDVVLQVVAHIVGQEHDRVAGQREEDDEPQNLTNFRQGTSCVAEAPDGRLGGEVGHRGPDDLQQPHGL